jgi:hypothetical protein
MCYGFEYQSISRVDRCVVCCWMESIPPRDEVHVITAIVEDICCHVGAYARESMRGLSAELNVLVSVLFGAIAATPACQSSLITKIGAECVPLGVHLLLRDATP